MNFRDYQLPVHPASIVVLNQQQTRSRLEKILNQVTAASNIVSQHRTIFTRGGDQQQHKEGSANRSVRQDIQGESLDQRTRLKPIERLYSPEVSETSIRGDFLSPGRPQQGRNRIQSKMEVKPKPSNVQMPHKNETSKFDAWQEALNSLQSRVQEARIGMGKSTNQKPTEQQTARYMNKEPEKVDDTEIEEDMFNTKTIVKVGSVRSKGSTTKQQLPYRTTYYVPELIRSINERHSLAMQHIRQSIGIFKYFLNFKRKPEEAAVRLELPQSQLYKNKKTLVFDLDETLIHYSENGDKHCDISLSIIMPTGQTVQAHVSIRPYALTLLSKLKDKFQLIVFTASEKTYANTVLNFLDPDNRIFQHRLYTEHCYKHPEGPIKDLEAINRPPESIVLIDNSPYSYGIQQDSAIPILPYYGDEGDCQLKRLQQYLSRLEHVPDVRVLNRSTFQLHRYTDFAEAKPLITELYMQAS